MNPNDPTASIRRRAYVLMIAVAASMAAGRVLSTENVVEPHLARPADAPPDDRTKPWPTEPPRAVPTFGSNDRSRWATVRALVDEGTYVIGRRDPEKGTPDNKYGDEGIVFEDGWKTIDKVLHPQRLQYYSSKPPLLPTMVAGEYWLLKHLFGWSIKYQPDLVIRFILLTINVVPFVLYLWLLARLAEEYGASDWGRLFVVAGGCFGTLLTPFLITFNNHTPAAFGAMVAFYAAMRVAFPRRAGGVSPLIRDGSDRISHQGAYAPRSPGDASPWWLLLAGLAAGFTIACELPAAALAAALALLLLVRAPGRTLLWFVPAALLPVAALLFTNYLALGEIVPAYEKTDTIWYQYEGSVWRSEPGQVRYGIEFAKRSESRGMYAFHLLLGHHGWFSLTPINLLGLAGIGVALFTVWRRLREGKRPPVPVASGPPGSASGLGWSVAVAGALAVSGVVFVFYAFVVETANYGGWTCAPRWLLWLTPLWLVAMLPAADWLGRKRWGRVLCVALLAVSVASAAYPAWNPWRHPWLYNWMEAAHWIEY